MPQAFALKMAVRSARSTHGMWREERIRNTSLPV